MNPRASAPFTTLYGRFLTRMAVAITALAIIVFSVPSSFEYYGGVCTAASEVCSERAVEQSTPEGVRALREAGLSLRTYALLNVVLDKVFQLAWFAVGALIFWRRSDKSMALLVADGLLRAGRAGSRSCSPLFKLAVFSSPSCTLVRPGDGLVLGVLGDRGEPGPRSILTLGSPLRHNVDRQNGSSSARLWL